MLTLRNVLTMKGPEVVQVPGDTTVLEAVRTMSRRGVGSVLVVDDGVLAGVFAERDALRRVLARRRDPAATLVRDVMSTGVEAAPPDMAMREALHLMSERRVRHLPVGREGVLLGLVSLGDLAKCAARELDRRLEDLTSYVDGPLARHDSDWPFPNMPSASYPEELEEEAEIAWERRA